MTDPVLTKRVRDHYAGRAFSPSLIGRLCAEIERRSGPSGVEIAKGWWVPFEPLISAFEPIDQATRPAVLHASPTVILTLTFGYRLESPTARFPADRQPGPNNIALALMTERCQRLFPDAWVAVQHEVGLALADRSQLTPDLVTPARDWNTTQVIEYFVQHIPRHAFASNRNVLVVSHLHHFGRCARILAGAGLRASPPPKEVPAYADYDALEAQPRYRSPWEYLVNDFLSISKTATSRSGMRRDRDQDRKKVA